MSAYERVAQWLKEAERAVAFTGAGVSTESGIPDFRSPGGVWAQNQPVYFDDFLARADARCEYWRQKSLAHADFQQARPNVGHRVLAKWELQGRLRGLITQNIDGLHQLAGSRQVQELHGTARQVACLDCHARFDADVMVRQFLASQTPPPCPACGGLTKHATISFGQALPESVLRKCLEWAAEADLFLAIGSSLVVEPAASLPRLAAQSAARLVIINRDPTPQDGLARITLREPIGQALERIDVCFGKSQGKSE